MRRMRRRTRNKLVAAGGVIGTLALGLIIVTGVSQAGDDEIDKFLGKAVEYGIVAESINQTSDMETNFAAIKYTNNSQWIGNTVGTYTNAAGEIVVGEVTQDLKVKGQGTVVTTTEANKEKVLQDYNTSKGVQYSQASDEEISEAVKTMIANTKSYASSVVGKSNFELPEVNDQNKYVVDFSQEVKATKTVTKTKPVTKTRTVTKEREVADESASGSATKIETYEVEEEYTEDEEYTEEEEVTTAAPKVIYVQGLAELMADGKIQNRALVIKKRADQTIVINSTIKNFNMYGYKVEIVDGGATTDEIGASIIWNLPDVIDLHINAEGAWIQAATIIAPEASVNLDVTSQGWLVCNNIVANSGEWHMISRKVPECTPRPEETPTPTPEVTATPSPTPEVTATPSPTPEITATPSPTPEVTATPSPSPEVTATPSPTPEVTATPSPTPEITATPSPTPEITATPSPTPEVTPTPTPEVTTTPEITATPSPSPEVTPTATPKVDETPVPTGKEEVPPPSVETSTPVPSEVPEEVEEKFEETVSIDDEEVPKTILEEDVPLSAVNPPTKPKSKRTVVILDEDVPLADTVPETGDTMNPIIPIAGMGISLLAMCGVLFIRKKKVN